MIIMKKTRTGFTLIEIILVIAILALLATAAFAYFYNIQDEAVSASEAGVVGAVRAGISNYASESSIQQRVPLYPNVLDSASNGAASLSNPFFANVLENPLTQDWSKDSALRYTGPTGDSYEYDPALGTFEISSAMLTPLGSTFTEITGNMAQLIQDFYDDNGRYPRSWGDYRFTDIGLEPGTWDDTPYEGVIYEPGGNRISVKPEAGWQINVMGIDGSPRTLTEGLNWNIWYDMATGAWYYHNIEPGEEIDISTMEVVEE